MIVDNNQKPTSLPHTEEFPFPNLVKMFDFFFPKEKHSKDIFTMENLRKFGPKAPILGLIVLLWIFLWVFFDGLKMQSTHSNSAAICGVIGAVVFIFGIAKYLWWLVMAVVSKIARRSPVVCLAMTASGPLQALAISCIAHFIGLVCRLLAYACEGM